MPSEAIILIDATPFEMLLIDEISQEEDVSVFDLIMFVDYFNDLFLNRATVESLLTAKKHFSESTKEILIRVYSSLERYEYCEVLNS